MINDREDDKVQRFMEKKKVMEPFLFFVLLQTL